MQSDQGNANSSNDDEHLAKAQEFKNAGNDKFNKNNYKGAIIDYKKGLLHEPDNADLHANLSAAYIHLEKYIDAEEHAVYTIHLKPKFYKGYMRAAKAAYGKGMTTLALKRLNKGISQVTDQNGIKELNRLKTQYTAYLSLKSNADREMDFSSDRYVSEDEEPYSGDNEDFDDEFFSQLVGLDDDEISATPPKQIDGITSAEVHISEKEVSAKDSRSLNIKDTTVQGKEAVVPKEQDRQSKRSNKRDVERTDVPENTEETLTEFKAHLKTGSEAFRSGNFRKAAESYKAAKDRVGVRMSDYEIDDREYHLIKYVHSTALINLGTYEDVVKAIQALTEMEVYKFSIPALYIQLARAYCKLNRYKTALEPLEKVQDILDNFMIFPTFSWPGTDETIEETTTAGLKVAVKELKQICRMSHKPTATCRYTDCLKTSTHILPSELIYRSDPDFIGFIRMICEEKCHIEFHIACWKSYKEAVSGIGKLNDKDFLGRPCLTMDCVNSDGKRSIVTVIEVIDADEQVKSVNKLDPKTIVDSKKAKKKRCKLDDKEKIVKLKKTKEKRVREVKKPVVVVEEEDDVGETIRTGTDTEKELKSRIETLKELRLINVDKWDPKTPFYGRADEMEKWVEKCEQKSSNVEYMEYSNEESIDVKDAKEFIFSYFMEILKIEGPLKQEDVEDLWKEVAEDFCNIKVVLPNLKSMCDLLIESTCFCQIEDYICLAGQLNDAYETVKSELVDTVNFLMSGTTSASSGTPAQTQLPDLLHHNKTSKPEQDVSQSSSEDESSESEEEYNSDQSESGDESDEGNSEVEEEPQNSPTEGLDDKIEPPVEEEATEPKVEELDGEKFSLQKMLDEMSRVKNMFLKTNSDEPNNSKKDQEVESPHNDTFETAHGSSQTYSVNDLDSSDSSFEDHKTDLAQNDDIDKENVETVICDQLHQEDDSANTIENSNVPDGAEIPIDSDKQTPIDDLVCDQASQTEVSVEERQMQTTVLETKDTLSQTIDAEVYRELKLMVQKLDKKIDNLTVENAKLSQEVIEKENVNKQIKNIHKTVMANIQKDIEKTESRALNRIRQLQEEYKKNEAGFRKKEEDLVNTVAKMKKIQLNLMTDNQKLNKDVASLVKRKKELEANEKTIEKKIKAKIISSQEAQLAMTKAFWESQVNLLGKRCVEKLSEMHSWFSLLPSGEVEELPSWKDVRQITIQWGEVSNKIQQIQTEFQTMYNDLEARLSRGEELDDLNTLSLPTLPDEPNPLPLDKIHKEITEKHTKRISELTQLVANQQLEIEKIKENSQQLQQTMGPFQMAPRMQTPLTTAFGSLAFQYPYPHLSQFGSTNIPILPPNQDISKVGVNKPLQADVQTLLKESTTGKFNMYPPESTSVNGNSTASGLTNASGSTFSSSLLNIPPPSMMPPPSAMGIPPPPVAVGHSLLKASSVQADKKDKKPVDQSTPSKPDSSKSGSSRETTPVPASTTNPTPEKSKKKKKNKVDVREDPEFVPRVAEASSMSEETDTTPWSVITMKKSLPKHTPQWPNPTPDYKLKNKKRLLDKLQLKFPTMPLKDLDEIVKLVREQNNGSLSGLPFEEIETRVERFISKKQFQKTSTMGLVKFSDAAWGPVKQQETVKWTNVQLEECTICLELMSNDRTKVDCNHEFHTKCLRKWLKEKSVCPLCNKFTTMPDEFPAL